MTQEEKSKVCKLCTRQFWRLKKHLKIKQKNFYYI